MKIVRKEVFATTLDKFWEDLLPVVDQPVMLEILGMFPYHTKVISFLIRDAI